MRIKFNKFERVAGLFVMTAFGGVLVSGVFVAFQKGWFERKVEFKTSFETANGLNPGSQVQMSGLRVGAVESVDLVSEKEVKVVFQVSMRHASKIRTDSVVKTIRPFLIGDKVLDISVGSESAAVAKAGAALVSESSLDIMDVLGGRQLGNFFQEMGSLMTSLKTVLTAFSDPKRAEAMVKLFDELHPLVVNANQMSAEMTKLGRAANKKKGINKIVDNLVVMTETLNRAMPQIQQAIESSPHLAKDITAIVENLSKMTTEMNKVLPALAEVAPELPKASRRAIEAMNEAVIVLKAMQKSFFLKGSANEVREEELAAEKKKQKDSEGERSPASE